MGRVFSWAKLRLLLMYISGFHIDGFGIYHNLGIQDLPPGLVVFVGDNESGKTTLMEFFRAVLFGPRRGAARNDYPPFRGGNHGGRLVLRMHDGRRVMVERLGKAATVAVDGGAPQRGEPGELLLGGIDRITFEHIFALGLEELQGLKVLDHEGVRGRLFSAGAGLGAASVPAALKSIDEELGTLWAPRSKKRLAQLIDRRRGVEKEIKDLQGQAAAYAAEQRRKEDLEARIRRERAEMEGIRLRLRRLEQLQQARKPWADMLTGWQRVKELEGVKDFPPYGLEQLARLKKDREEIQLGLKEREGEAADLRARLEQKKPDDALIRHREEIETLFGEREKIATMLGDLPSLRKSLARAEEEYKQRLKDLGPDWEAHRLAQVDTSVAVRQQVQEFGRKLDQAERRSEQLRIQEQILAKEAEEARRKQQEARRAWAQLPAPAIRTPAELREKLEALASLRGLFHRRELLQVQWQDRSQREEEARARLALLREQLEATYDPVPWWAFLSVILTGFVLDVIFSTHASHLAGNLAFLAGLLAAGLLYLWRRRLLALEKVRRLRFQEEARLTENALRSWSTEIAALAGQASRVEQEIAELYPKVASSPLREVSDLERRAIELQQAAEQLQAWQALGQERAKTEEALQHSLERLDQARQEADQAAAALQDLQAEWRRWLKAHGLPESLQPAAFEALLQAVARARESEGKVGEARQRLKDAEAYVAEARNRILHLLAICGRSPQGPEAGVEDLDGLRRALAEALELDKERQELQHRLNVSREQLAHLRAHLQNKEQELQQLLKEAGAANEDDFRRLAALHQEYLDCRKHLEQSEIALLSIAGNPEALKGLQEELSRTDPLALQGEKEKLEARLRLLEESLPQADQEVGRLKLKLQEMAQDERLGNLLQEQSVLEEQLQEALKRWAALVVSRHLVEVARGIYERERQPQVIQEAARFLEIMTGERRRLVSLPGEPGLQLEDPALRRKGEIQWSAGLADQVYLAVRLGLAREFGRHVEPLPVILDDVLVKFDPRRRRGAARVILEFARQQQVLLFTCHPEFQKIIANLHREDYFQGTPVSYFRIADGALHAGCPEAAV